jgi:hypothetical protein
MPFTQFTNLDFDQIKTSIKDYLRANSNFTDFDFEGSNFSVLIDTLAYNTYITAFNSNMVVNESFLDSATLRENVVSLARNIGYVPRSRTASRAVVDFTVPTTTTSPTLTLQAGLVCVGSSSDTTYTFSIPESITTTVNNNIASFSDINIYQGTFLRNQFVVDGSLDQRFTLDNSFIDTSTIVVHVKGISDTGLGRQYRLVDNILNIRSSSEIYLIQEIKDEKYELLFGDGIFGKKLENGTIITVSYIITDGKSGNGASLFSFSGSLRGSSDEIITSSSTVSVITKASSSNGGDIEGIDSIKYFAPRLYSSQYRAVTGRDYESIIQQIYPNTESVSVVGGEELDPPRFGTVLISIKPKNGDYVSDFDKQQILNKLKNYSLAGINQSITDLKILYVEIDSAIYYDSPKVSNTNDLKTRVTNALTYYATSTDVNKFGGRFKYSKLVRIIDDVDSAITSNITRVIIRRNLKASLNVFAQYELCFGNQFHINSNGFNIKSTGFKILGELDTVYLTDVPKKNTITGNLDGSGMGDISIVKPNLNGIDNIVVVKSAGTINYTTGEILLTTINIISTDLINNIIQVQAYPESNDIIGLKDLYLNFSISDSTINMVKDTISSGEQISGIGFKVTSNYLNGELKRI